MSEDRRLPRKWARTGIWTDAPKIEMIALAAAPDAPPLAIVHDVARIDPTPKSAVHVERADFAVKVAGFSR